MPDPTLGAVIASWALAGPSPRSDWAPWAWAPGIADPGRGVRVVEALAQAGLGRCRLGLDWARLQTSDGRLDPHERERVDDILLAARTVGIEVWATLVDGPVPGWFADEGGFADDRATGRHWPRWVEAAAEAFGDRLSGWFPLSDPVGLADAGYRLGLLPPGRHDPLEHARVLTNQVVAWRDAWRILRGGPPVATALLVGVIRPSGPDVEAGRSARDAEARRWRLWWRALRDGVVAVPGRPERAVADLAGALDVLGVALDDRRAGPVDDARRSQWHRDVGEVLRRATEEGPDRPLTLASVRVHHPADDARQRLLEATAQAVAEARADGIVVDAVFADPATDPPPGDPTADHGIDDGILTRDLELKESGAAWLEASRP